MQDRHYKLLEEGHLEEAKGTGQFRLIEELPAALVHYQVMSYLTINEAIRLGTRSSKTILEPFIAYINPISSYSYYYSAALDCSSRVFGPLLSFAACSVPFAMVGSIFYGYSQWTAEENMYRSLERDFENTFLNSTSCLSWISETFNKACNATIACNFATVCNYQNVTNACSTIADSLVQSSCNIDYYNFWLTSFGVFSIPSFGCCAVGAGIYKNIFHPTMENNNSEELKDKELPAQVKIDNPKESQYKKLPVKYIGMSSLLFKEMRENKSSSSKQSESLSPRAQNSQ